VECSPLNIGGGVVGVPGGTMPVPSPITAEILRQAAVPLYGTDSNRELVTPTGAAIIVSVASAFGSMPTITINRLGYGLGRADGSGSSAALRLTIGDLVPQRNPQRRSQTSRIPRRICPEPAR